MAQTTVTTKLNERGIASLYNGRNSPVGKHVNQKANEALKLSKVYVGVKSRTLKRSLRKSPVFKTFYGLKIEVGTGIRYSLLHHNGTRPHTITPKRPGYPLRFQVDGKTIYAYKVNHPGTKPNPYLSRALKEVFRGDA